MTRKQAQELIRFYLASSENTENTEDRDGLDPFQNGEPNA